MVQRLGGLLDNGSKTMELFRFSGLWVRAIIINDKKAKWKLLNLSPATQDRNKEQYHTVKEGDCRAE